MKKRRKKRKRKTERNESVARNSNGNDISQTSSELAEDDGNDEQHQHGDDRDGNDAVSGHAVAVLVSMHFERMVSDNSRLCGDLWKKENLLLPPGHAPQRLDAPIDIALAI